MEIKVVAVTPEIALMWLGGNSHNRPKSRRAVDAYARDMVSGAWLLSGDTIKFSSEGKLLDGQHRLEAVVASGATVAMAVAVGVDEKAQEVVDLGRRRRASDILALRGESNSKLAGSTCRIVLSWEVGARWGLGQVGVYTRKAIADRMDDRIRRSLVPNGTMRTIISPTTLSFCKWLFTDLDEDDGAAFVAALSEGIDMEAKSYISQANIVRERLIKDYRPGRKLSTGLVVAMSIIGWNAFRRRETIKIIKTPRVGEYPVPI